MADFSSDDELLRHVRGQVGAKSADDLPEEVLKEELGRGKREINQEVRERLNRGGSLNLYGNEAPAKALEYFMLVRGRANALQKQMKRGNGPPDDLPDVSNAPKSVASMRRHDFGDQTLNHWRDRMVTHLNKVTE